MSASCAIFLRQQFSEKMAYFITISNFCTIKNKQIFYSFAYAFEFARFEAHITLSSAIKKLFQIEIPSNAAK